MVPQVQKEVQTITSIITALFNICVQNSKRSLSLREGIKKKKKLVEFSTKVGGWGQQWTDFPLIFFFFFWKKYELKPLKIA